MFGFRLATYGPVTSQLTAEALFDISGTRYIYLTVDDNKVNMNDFIIGNLQSSYLNENILARITLPNEKYQIISNNSYEPRTQEHANSLLSTAGQD